MIRLLLTAFLVTASATAGYYWGTYTSNNFAHQSDFLLAGFALVLCAILASAALDFIHTKVDDRSDVDSHELERLARTRGTEDFAVKDMQRVMDELTKENLRLMEQLTRRNHHPR